MHFEWSLNITTGSHSAPDHHVRAPDRHVDCTMTAGAPLKKRLDLAGKLQVTRSETDQIGFVLFEHVCKIKTPSYAWRSNLKTGSESGLRNCKLDSAAVKAAQTNNYNLQIVSFPHCKPNLNDSHVTNLWLNRCNYLVSVMAVKKKH